LSKQVIEKGKLNRGTVKKNAEIKSARELRERLYAFALRVVEFVKSLPRTWIARELGRQLLKSGTSVAANYEEACGAFSKDDFTYKINTALKEARESNYWLRLIRDSELNSSQELDGLIEESEAICKILGKSLVTARRKELHD
jgi:four helix bundle protein